MSKSRANKDTAAESATVEATTENTATDVESKAEAESKAKSAADEAKTVVYCGPSVRGVVRQYTVFEGEIPSYLLRLINNHPAVNALVVPVEKMAETRAKVEQTGTAESILFKKIKSEIGPADANLFENNQV